jgi:hypothetical protein
LFLHKKCYFTSIKINPLVPRVSLVDEQFDAAKTKHPHKLLSKNIYCNEQLFKSHNFAEYTGHLTLASEGNIFLYLFYFMTPCILYVCTTILRNVVFHLQNVLDTIW